MKISDLKFGDKFRFSPNSVICVITKKEIDRWFYSYISKAGSLINVATYVDSEVEPIGSVEQDKKLVERALPLVIVIL